MERKGRTVSKIEIRDLTKSYDGTLNILEKISLDVEEGEFYVLVGPSGCGKSTLLRIIAGLEKITSGTLKIDGKLANNMLPKDRNLSMVFQNYALYPHMTVKDNILFGLDVKKVPKDEQKRRLDEAAEMLGLTPYLKRKPRELSGGQRQRVALARSVCSQSPICLMDEPLSNLDAKLRGQMRTEIRRLQKKLGLTVIYVTHDQVEAMTMGDRIMVLHGGKIQQTGTPLELYNKPANTFVAGFIGSPQMNQVQAKRVGSTLVLGDSVTLPLSGEEIANLPQGNQWQIGIRAEQIEPASTGTEGVCRVKVVNTEMMGNETQVLFEVGDALFTARWTGQYLISIGSDLAVHLSANDFHFFDAEKGTLIRPALHIKGRAALSA